MHQRLTVTTLAAIALGFCVLNAKAADKTWDAGVDNIWDTATTANWTGTTWAANDRAIFGAAGVGTVSVTGAGISANRITFNTAGYTLSGGPVTLVTAGDPVIAANESAVISSDIQMTGAQTWNVAAGKTLTLGNVNATAANTAYGIGGNGSYIYNGSIGSNVNNVLFNSTGTGTTATFTTANTFTGRLWLGNGANPSVLNFSNTDQLGTGSAGGNDGFIALQNGSTLRFTGTGAQTVATRWLYWNSGNATIDVQDGGADLKFNISGGTLGGGGGTFTKAGSGTLTLVTSSFSPNLSKPVSLTAGTLALQADASRIFYITSGMSGASGTTINILAGAGTVRNDNLTADWSSNLANLDVAATATFDIRGNNVLVDSLTGGGVINNSYYQANSGIIGHKLTVGVDNGSGTFSGSITGTGTTPAVPGQIEFVKTGSGTQTLSGASITYAGPTSVNGGRLVLANTTGFASATTVGSGNTLEIALSSNWTPGAGVSFAGSGTIEKTGTGTLNLGSGSFGGVSLGSGGLLDIQAGTVTNDNIVTGKWASNLGSVNVGASGTFDIRSENTQIDALTGTGTVKNSYGVYALTVGAAGGSGTFSGTMLDGGGTLNLTKTGAGTQTLSGNNLSPGLTGAGTLTVSQGTLKFTGITTGFSNIYKNTIISSGATLQMDVDTGATNGIGAFSGGATALTGAGTLLKTGAGNGDIGFYGGTRSVAFSSGALIQVSGGTLFAHNTGSSTMNWSSNNASLTVDTGAIFDLRGGNVTVDALNGTGTVRNSSGIFALTVGSAGSSGTFTGTLQDGGGTLNLTKTGAGTQTLSGNSLSSGLSGAGTLTVNQGTLKFTGISSGYSNIYRSTVINGGGTLQMDVATGQTNGIGAFSGGATAFTGTGTLLKTGDGTGDFGLYGGVRSVSFSAGALIQVGGGVLRAHQTGSSTMTWTNNNAGLAVDAGATFDLRGGNVTVDALTGAGTVQNTIGNFVLTVGTADGSGSFGGLLQNPSATLSLSKTGSGTQTLTGANSYSGGTTITAGTLLANNATGSATGSGPVSVNGGTLGGNGFISGNVTVNSGVFAPGNSIDSLDTGALALLGTSTFALQINTSAITTDLANVTGNFSLDAGNTALLTIADLGSDATLLPGTTFVFVDYSGSWNGGLFDLNGSNVLADDEVFPFGANYYRISYNGSTNLTTDVVLEVVAVPEPGSFTTMFVGSLIFWLIRRNRS